MKYEDYWEAGGERPTKPQGYWDKETFWAMVWVGIVALGIAVMSMPELFSYIARNL